MMRHDEHRSPSSGLMETFEPFDLEVHGSVVHGVTGGDGPPVLLLHGIPETHLMWHRVAPVLAERYTVVATDLRGYGDSGVPESDAEHRPYSMRAIAAEQVAAMKSLGHGSFAVVGHDRGARCAYRMALDHAAAVDRVCVLDVVPTGHAFAVADADFSLGYWVWSFLAAPYPLPEELVARAPDVFVDHLLDTWSADPGCFGPELRAAYTRQFRQADRLHAICEQYRAAATIDVGHDGADLGSVVIEAPLLVLWSRLGPVDAWYEPVEVWRAWARHVGGKALDCGHFLPEEAPEEVATELLMFLEPLQR